MRGRIDGALDGGLRVGQEAGVDLVAVADANAADVDAAAVALNAAYVVIEGAVGLYANSVAVLADAGHNLSDVLTLLMAWAALLVAKRAPEGRYTYGLRGGSILAALANAMLLLIACGAMGLEALQRWAADDLRSLNGQIEFLLRRALQSEGRAPRGPGPTPRK